jgi:L-ascorbate metabolism protein UlaG (beta-lactamase superfamily)
MPDTFATSAGTLTIVPIHHASLILSVGKAVIYVDPVGAERFAGQPAATAVLFTHGHSDHFDLPTLHAVAAELPETCNPDVAEKLPPAWREKAQVLANGDKGHIEGFEIEAMPAYNLTPDRQNYHPRGIGNGYVLSIGGKRIYIAGDTEDTPEMRALRGIDVAFLPMNLPYTMEPEQAADAAQAFRPVVVYPYHYGGSDFPQVFARLLDGTGISVRLADWY